MHKYIKVLPIICAGVIALGGCVGVDAVETMNARMPDNEITSSETIPIFKESLAPESSAEAAEKPKAAQPNSKRANLRFPLAYVQDGKNAFYADSYSYTRENTLYGVIDGNGEVVIPFVYSDMWAKSYGYHCRRKDGEAWVEDNFDLDGQPVDLTVGYPVGSGDFYTLPAEEQGFDDLIRRSDSAKLAKVDCRGENPSYRIYVNDQGQRRLTIYTQYDETHTRIYDYDKLLSVDPKEVETAEVINDKFRNYGDGEGKSYFIYTMSDEGIIRCARGEQPPQVDFLDFDGNLLASYPYESIGRSDDGYWLATVPNPKNPDGDGLTGYVSPEGEELIPFQYREAHFFVGDYALVQEYVSYQEDFGDEGWRIIDRQGNNVIAPEVQEQLGSFMSSFGDSYFFEFWEQGYCGCGADGGSPIYLKYDGTLLDFQQEIGILDGDYVFTPLYASLVKVLRQNPDQGTQSVGVYDIEAQNWLIPLAEDRSIHQRLEKRNPSFFGDLGNELLHLELISRTTQGDVSSDLYSEDGRKIAENVEMVIGSANGEFIVEVGGKWQFIDEKGVLQYVADPPPLSAE